MKNVEYKKNGILLSDGTFLTLEHITNMCNTIKAKEDNLVILQMSWNGRGGEVFEQICLPKKKAVRIQEILQGQEVYFGEIWGKHSEVYGEMEESDFKIKKDKELVKAFLEKYPSAHEYDHSFIFTFIDRFEDDPESCENVTEEMIKELRSILAN